MAGIRMHSKDTVHFVTNRCHQERLLLLPDDTINFIIGYWFARALDRFGQGLEIYGFIFLSNHFHLLCKDTKGTLARFMGYFQGNLAKTVNEIRGGRKGKFWAREYDDMIVDDDDNAFLNRYAYLLANPAKAGLVNRASEWIGWSSLDAALTGARFEFSSVNRTKLHNATRRNQKVDESDFVETYGFELTVPPMWEGKPQEEIAELTQELVKSAEVEYGRRRDNKPALGVEHIRSQSPFDRPVDPSFRPRIKFFALTRERVRKLLGGYRVFVGNYKTQMGGFLKAAMLQRPSLVEWPVGSYPPSSNLPVGNGVWTGDDIRAAA
ncbi:MAG: hypothetical protein GY854_27690 [Deltaproteobacteria bacterium]|nr:hypothetical protein [Deltaproteobacteria bacterium]